MLFCLKQLMSRFHVVALALLFAVTVAGCGGGSSTSTADMDGDGMTMPEPTDGDGVTMPEPTAYEKAKAAIAGAETAEDAQAAYDAVKDDVTATEGETLQAAVDARVEAMATMARVAAQRSALMMAAGAVDTSSLTTQAEIDAAQMAINALQMALDAAADVSDADNKAMYQTQLETAGEAVRMAQTGLDTEGRMMAQRMDIADAVMAARSAVNMVDGDATDAQVTAADNAVAALKAAIDGAEDLPEGDADVASAQGTLDTLGGQLSSAKTHRMNAMDDAQRAADMAMADTQKAADMAMAATAAKLYDGISAATDDTDVATRRSAAYNDDATMITVQIGVETDEISADLSEDKKTMVADNHGWAGKRYTDPAGGDMYEAFVYSNVEAPMQGKKFGGATENNEFQYVLVNGMLAIDTTEDGVPARVALTGVTRTAGTETFNFPDQDDSGALIITGISGSFHGVSGTYSCTPSARADGCSALVAASGFTLTDGAWTFRPGDANARIMSAGDTAYASYGWWLRKSAGGNTFTASAFVDEKDGAAAFIGITALKGTATYMGGAAGKYALSSPTGGTNDAGHFTARATLQADFTNNLADTGITGTIDQFVGADGESRDWEVELGGSDISDAGDISIATTGTVWTIGKTDADASGQWSGSLRNIGGDGVPQVAIGTFYTEYGTAGRMVGAFGANKQ